MNNENQNQNPEEIIEEDNLKQTKTFADSVMESVKFVVDMMNSGKVNSKDVYPPGRYHGD